MSCGSNLASTSLGPTRSGKRWCGILGELYGGPPKTRFARDVGQVSVWGTQATHGDSGAQIPVTVSSATFAESRLLSLRTRQSAAYKGLHALLMATGAKDWKFHKTFDCTQYVALDVDVHHVFPQKWCDDNHIAPAPRESIVGAHLIDTDAPRAADFDRYFLARRRALLDLVEQDMGKRAQRDVDAGELTGGHEAPEAFAEEPNDPQNPDDLLVDDGG